MSLRSAVRGRFAAAARDRLARVAVELEAQAPHRDIRQSLVVPIPEELPDVLRWIRQQRDVGQPEIHLGARLRPPVFLKPQAKEGR